MACIIKCIHNTEIKKYVFAFMTHWYYISKQYTNKSYVSFCLHNIGTIKNIFLCTQKHINVYSQIRTGVITKEYAFLECRKKHCSKNVIVEKQ